MRYLLALAFVVGIAAGCGGGSGSTPASTPTPACTLEPTPSGIEVAPCVYALARPAPPLPSGATALSSYYELSAGADSGLVVGLPLKDLQNSTANVGFYSYNADGAWAGIKGTISVVQDGHTLQGVFSSVPKNMIVLYWPQSSTSPNATATG